MAHVVSLTKARRRREQLQARPIYNASPFMSPVPQLIELLEPILESVRDPSLLAAPETHMNLMDYLDLLALARREIDQLEDMAWFLKGICESEER